MYLYTYYQIRVTARLPAEDLPMFLFFYSYSAAFFWTHWYLLGFLSSSILWSMYCRIFGYMCPYARYQYNNVILVPLKPDYFVYNIIFYVLPGTWYFYVHPFILLVCVLQNLQLVLSIYTVL